MALNLNKVIIAGRLCADPEVKTTQSGLSIVTVRVAVNRRTKSGDHPEADFFTVTAWRQTAEFIGKYFRKGSAICVVGSLTVRTWEDRDGNRRQSTEIIADEALFAESKQDWKIRCCAREQIRHICWNVRRHGKRTHDAHGLPPALVLGRSRQRLPDRDRRD